MLTLKYYLISEINNKYKRNLFKESWKDLIKREL